jgi:RimJ/RimL family protein N-acetyltransferase
MPAPIPIPPENEVELRNVIAADLETFFEQQLDPEAYHMAAFPPRERAAFMTHWKKIMADETNYLRTILYQGRVAGNMVSFVLSGEREVGYWIGKEFWGKGIATRALAKFLEIVRVRPLYAHVAKHNLASLRVLEKCGFSLSGEDAGFSATGGENVEGYILELGSSK